MVEWAEFSLAERKVNVKVVSREKVKVQIKD